MNVGCWKLDQHWSLPSAVKRHASNPYAALRSVIPASGKSLRADCIASRIFHGKTVPISQRGQLTFLHAVHQSASTSLTFCRRAFFASLLTDGRQQTHSQAAVGRLCPALSGESARAFHQTNKLNCVAIASSSAKAIPALTATRARPAKISESVKFMRSGERLSCVFCTRSALRKRGKSRDVYRQAVPKLSLRKIGLCLQGIVGRTRRHFTLPTSGKATSGQPSAGSAASSSRPARSCRRSFRNYTNVNNPRPLGNIAVSQTQRGRRQVAEQGAGGGFYFANSQ